MNEMDWTPIMAALMVLLQAVLLWGIAEATRYIRSKTTLEQRQQASEALDSYGRIVVDAVEQLGAAQGWTSKQKKAEAIARITAWADANNIPITTQQVDTLIESVVAGLTAARMELTRDPETGRTVRVQ